MFIVVASVHKSFAAMHLMYTLDESGNRIYTLNVSIFTVMERLLFDFAVSENNRHRPNNQVCTPRFVSSDANFSGPRACIVWYTDILLPIQHVSRPMINSRGTVLLLKSAMVSC